MEKFIVYQESPDLPCKLVQIAPRFIEELKRKGVSEDTIFRLATEHIVPEAHRSSARVVNKALIPTSRYFRNAWTDANPTDTVDVDMGKARQMKMEIIRKERNKELERLDVEESKESNAEKLKALKAKKQELRDIPQRIDLDFIATPEELEALSLSNLDRVTPQGA